MTNRCTNLTALVILVGCLIFSIGYNLHQAQTIERLQNTIKFHSVSDPFDYEKIKEEILRLENVKYQ